MHESLADQQHTMAYDSHHKAPLHTVPTSVAWNDPFVTDAAMYASVLPVSACTCCNAAADCALCLL